MFILNSRKILQISSSIRIPNGKKLIKVGQHSVLCKILATITKWCCTASMWMHPTNNHEI